MSTYTSSNAKVEMLVDGEWVEIGSKPKETQRKLFPPIGSVEFSYKWQESDSELFSEALLGRKIPKSRIHEKPFYHKGRW